MKTKIFQGNLFAKEKEIALEKELKKLKSAGATPKLTTILVGDDKASKIFLSLKKKAAERIGAKIQVINLHSNAKQDKIITLIDKLNNDDLVNGIMIQLPLPKEFSVSDRKKLINAIDSKKDVDGMRDDSRYLSPTIKAVLEAMKEAEIHTKRPAVKGTPYTVAVVGAKGFVGKKLIKVLNEMGYKVVGVDLETKNLGDKAKDADILISATGEEGLITKGMVKKSAVVVDVGAPNGDVQFEGVAKKASFITPVPGGIGPVTIFFLLENLVEAASLQK